MESCSLPVLCPQINQISLFPYPLRHRNDDGLPRNPRSFRFRAQYQNGPHETFIGFSQLSEKIGSVFGFCLCIDFSRDINFEWHWQAINSRVFASSSRVVAMNGIPEVVRNDILLLFPVFMQRWV